MKLLPGLAAVMLAAFMTVAASAQTSVIFTNNDGTFTYTNSTQVLELDATPSGGFPGMLTAISGLSSFGVNDTAVSYNPTLNTCSPACLGTITLSTGMRTSGSVTSTDPTQAAQFGTGGNFTATYPGLAVSFTGTFSSASWTSAGLGSNTWNFFGTIVGGMLTINGTTTMIPTAVTVQLTTVGIPPLNHPNKGTVTFKDSGGTTNFSVAPEPGTLTLFGSGLIAVGLFARRRFSSKVPVPSR